MSTRPTKVAVTLVTELPRRWGSVRSTGGRLGKADDGVTAAGASSLGDIGRLWTIGDAVDGDQVRVRQQDNTNIGIKFEANVIATLSRVDPLRRKGSPAPE